MISGARNPLKRLEQVLGGTAGLTNSYADLNTLYTTAIRIDALDSNHENLLDVLRCLGVIVTTATRAPLPVINLQKLLGGRIDRYTLNHIAHSLSSVLYRGQKQGGAIRVSYPSFMDYITDRARSKVLCVDLELQNTILAECCLETLTKELKFNICGLETSHLLNSEVHDREHECELRSLHILTIAISTGLVTQPSLEWV